MRKVAPIMKAAASPISSGVPTRLAGLENPGYTAGLFSEPGTPTTNWAAAYGALTTDDARAPDGAGDPASLPEAGEPARVRADLTWARALH